MHRLTSRILVAAVIGAFTLPPLAAPRAADALDAFIQRDPGPLPEPPADMIGDELPATVPGFEFPIEALDMPARSAAPAPAAPQPAPTNSPAASPAMAGMAPGMMPVMPMLVIPVMPMMSMMPMAPMMPAMPMVAPSAGAPLDVESVRARLGQSLLWWGNPRLTVGPVAVRDEATIVADIVTRDGALVDRFLIDRRTGWTSRAE